MDKLVLAAIVLASLALAILAAFAFFHWQERRRVRQVNRWVNALLVARYGALPDRLTISCFEDFASPVIVRFEHPTTKVRHRMQFSCPSSVASFEFISEREEPR